MLVTNWLTNWLTDSCLVNLIDVTLVCEEAYSKLVEVVSVADVDDELGQYFAAVVWLRLRSWILVKIMKLGLVKILSLKLVEMLMSGWDFKVNA